MREILFRGKQIDTGAWVEGAFCMKDCDDPFGELVDRPTIIKYEPPHDGYWFRVHPETVGQFTGLTDKNGKKIFEGDILKRTNGNKYLWYVDFKLSAFCANQSNCNYACELGELLEMIEVEVIGNIHDNPELLEVADGN